VSLSSSNSGGIVFGRDFKERLFRYIGYKMAGKSDYEISVILKLPITEINRLSDAANIASRPVSLSSSNSQDNEATEAMEMGYSPSAPSAEDDFIEDDSTPKWYEDSATEKEARERAMVDICRVVASLPDDVYDFICRTLGICGFQKMSMKDMLVHYKLDKYEYLKKKRDAYYKLKIALYKGASV
jgi:hypothetical protein